MSYRSIFSRVKARVQAERLCQDKEVRGSQSKKYFLKTIHNSSRTKDGIAIIQNFERFAHVCAIEEWAHHGIKVNIGGGQVVDGTSTAKRMLSGAIDENTLVCSGDCKGFSHL